LFVIRLPSLYPAWVSRKSPRITAMIEAFQGQDLDPRYLAYFYCFNRQLYFEAHEVLEELWLPVRPAPQGNFYKALIQLAGAFVHLQKNRLGPSAALLKLARANFAPYPVQYERLNLAVVERLIAVWLVRLESSGNNPLTPTHVPQLALEPGRNPLTTPA
jgi:hypothetical protein